MASVARVREVPRRLDDDVDAGVLHNDQNYAAALALPSARWRMPSIILRSMMKWIGSNTRKRSSRAVRPLRERMRRRVV